MKISKYIILALLLSTAHVFAQGDVQATITVSDDAGGSQVLMLGLNPAATAAFDPTLGENELPPFPPSGVFEARFIGDDIDMNVLGQGSYLDYRTGDTSSETSMIHEIKYQVSSGASEVKIVWNLPEGATGTIEDLFGGVVVSAAMSDSGSTTVTNLAVDKLKLTINYTPTSTGVQEQETDALPATIQLNQNYPNPFNPETTISYQLPANNFVSLVIFNAMGQTVATLVQSQQNAGAHQVLWDASGMPSGIYHYRLETAGFSETKRMILMK